MHCAVSQIKHVFALCVLVTTMLAGSTVYASPVLWTDWAPVGTSPSAIVTKNSSYWLISSTPSNYGTVAIGMPSFSPLPYQLKNSPWYIKYEIVSGSSLCNFQPTERGSSLGGSSSLPLTTTGLSTTSPLTFTSFTSGQYGVYGVRFTGSSAASCSVKVYEIMDSTMTTIWSPSFNDDIIKGSFVLSTATSSSGGSVIFPEIISVSTENDQLWNFLMLYLVFVITLVLFIWLFKPFYVRE